MIDPIYEHIRRAAERGALSHAMLFTGPGDRLAAARFAAAALECTSETGEKPCGACPACRKVREGIHPDVITVVDPDHVKISVDVVRETRKDAFIRPNEGTRKVYIFPDCALLTDQGQNVLLKLVEEGPAYAAFLFCAENSAVLLQTIRSRCVEWKLRPSESRAEAPDGWEDFCRAIVEHRPGEIALAAAGLEKDKLSREELGALLECCRERFAEALLGRYRGGGPSGMERLTLKQLMDLTELLGKYKKDCGYNVTPGQVLGGLAVELEGFF